MEQQGLQGPRIALLIDFDNVILGVDDPPGFDAELVMNALRSRGVVVLGRAYGDWYRHNRHRRKLMEQGIELVETPAFGPIIKNSADIRIALDAFEIGMLQSHISEFCLVSGDSDFLPLIKRLQLLGKSVVVIAGNKFTSALIRQNCNEYISYENLLAESVGAKEDATTLEGAFALLQRTVSTMDERGQDARSSSVKQMMLQLNPVFSERSFGCHQFKQFLDKACAKGIIRLDRRDTNSGEYQVMLLDENGHGIHEEQESAPNGKPQISDLEIATIRTKRPNPRNAKPTAEPAKEKAEETSVEDEIANNASTVPSSRRGRLKFSGRTWRSGGTSVKAEIAVGESKADGTEEKTAAEPVVKVNEQPVITSASKKRSTRKVDPKTEKLDETAKGESEEKPKQNTTRRRKETTSSSKASSEVESNIKEAKRSAEEKSKKIKPAKKTAAKSSEKAEEGDSKEKPKKPTRRRQTTSKKPTEQNSAE
ncbi:MAG: NYN domain-containing protein [Abditibacteriaceae bacterium]